MKHSSIVMSILLSVGICSTVQSQWVQTNGPNGGQVNCLAVSGDDSLCRDKRRGLSFD